MIQLDSRIWSK